MFRDVSSFRRLPKTTAMSMVQLSATAGALEGPGPYELFGETFQVFYAGF